MKAVILAAGRGSRLEPITDHCHKALLRVAGQPILSWQIQNLSRFGVDEVVVVTGYRGDTLEEACGVIDDQIQGTDVTTVRNEEWETTENLYSVSLTEERVRGDSMVLLNCDIVPEPELFERVVGADDESIAPYDPSEPDEDALQIELDGDSNPKNILDKGHEDGDGATLGFFSLDAAASDALFVDIENYLHRSDVRAFWFEHSLSRMFDSLEFEAMDVSDSRWFEIDTEADLVEAWIELGRSEEDVRTYIEEVMTDLSDDEYLIRETQTVPF